MGLRVALDWVPNPIHAGMLVARELGWYFDSGIDMEFLSPEEDNYAKQPIDKLIDDEVEMAVCPPELLIDRYVAGNDDLIAVASLLSDNFTSIIAHKHNNDAPFRKMGVTYQPLGLPWEELWINHLFEMAGAQKPPVHLPPTILDYWKVFTDKHTDSIWIFDSIEGVDAKVSKLKTATLKFEDFGIPYPACPLLVTKKAWIENNRVTFRNMVFTTEEGYRYAAKFPGFAANEVFRANPGMPLDQYERVFKMQSHTSELYLDTRQTWGRLNRIIWQSYISYLENLNIIPADTVRIDALCQFHW